MKASVRTILTVTLYFIFLALAFLANSSCATGQREIPPMAAPDVWELLDSDREYVGACRELTYVVATNPDIAEDTRNSVFFWNMVAGYKLLEYGGVVDSSEGIDRKAPFFVVNKAPLNIVEVWKERAKKEHALKCENCKAVTGDCEKLCESDPHTILGTAYQVKVDRISGIYVGETEVAYPPPPKKGNTRFCAWGGRVTYLDKAEHKHLRETVIIHEMGHLLGLSDTKGERDGVMSDKINNEIDFYQGVGVRTMAEMVFLYGESDYE